VTLTDLNTSLDLDQTGHLMYQLVDELYPICRSITGNGFRETLRILKKHIPLEIHEVPTGTRVFDWTVPKEWNIQDAYVKNAAGERVIDFRDSNLHVLNYSVPVHARMSLAELREHFYTLPDHPDWIPFRTSYFNENWGFCLSHKQYLELEDGEYEVCIDSSLEEGSLTYGEYYVRGKSTDEILLSCHACHPSLCNDNLSGVALTTFLARHLSTVSPRYSYRFLFIPGMIGAITWLSLNEDRVSRIKHGLVAACVGDPGPLNYKRSRRGDAEIDQAATHVLKQSSNGPDASSGYEIEDFIPFGYDERQYCSPGFDLAVGSLRRTPHGQYPEYHTSADNLDLVQPTYLADSLSKYLAVLDVLEGNGTYLNTNPKCEPQLGKRGLYQAIGGQANRKASQMAMLWVLNLADGKHTLLDIAERSSLPFSLIRHTADLLLDHGLLEEASE
jgi:aminopeptidase-like protein